jgi:hypothetical protein
MDLALAAERATRAGASTTNSEHHEGSPWEIKDDMLGSSTTGALSRLIMATEVR